MFFSKSWQHFFPYLISVHSTRSINMELVWVTTFKHFCPFCSCIAEAGRSSTHSSFIAKEASFFLWALSHWPCYCGHSHRDRPGPLSSGTFTEFISYTDRTLASPPKSLQHSCMSWQCTAMFLASRSHSIRRFSLLGGILWGMRSVHLEHFMFGLLWLFSSLRATILNFSHGTHKPLTEILWPTENIVFDDLTKTGLILIHSHQTVSAVLSVVVFRLTVRGKDGGAPALAVTCHVFYTFLGCPSALRRTGWKPLPVCSHTPRNVPDLIWKPPP